MVLIGCLLSAGLLVVVALAQAAVPGSANGLTLTLTLGSSTTSGNCLVVAIGTASTAAASTVSSVKLGGSVGNFASLISQSSGGSLHGDAEIWADPSCAGGQTAVLITVAGGSGANTGIGAVVYEVAGIAGTSPLDDSNSAIGTATSWSSGATGTSVLASEFWVGAYCGGDLSGGKSVTPPGAYTNITTQTATVTYFTAGYQIVSSTGAATYAGTQNSGAVNWAAAVATLKSGSGVLPSGSGLLAACFP